MRNRLASWGLILLFLLSAHPVWSSDATGRVVKVLPQLLDREGRVALSPSLFERDAYQAQLRKGAVTSGALRLNVQWKVKPTGTTNLVLRAELLTATGSRSQPIILEQPVASKSHWSHWTPLRLEGDALRQAGQLVAWRVTLLQGQTVLAEQHSFLW